MEQLNKVELRGTIGSVRTSNVGGKIVSNFSIATNYIYKAVDGTAIIETTWTNCTAFESDRVSCLDKLERGAKVSLSGRLRNQRYTGSDGTDRTQTDVLVKELHILDDETLTYQQ